MAKTSVKGMKEVQIPAPDVQTLKVTVIGDSSLICHKFSEKAKTEIKAKQEHKAKAAKAARDPEAEFKASLHEMGRGKYGFPAAGFKKGMVDACSFVDGITKTLARGAFFVMGDLLEIKGSKPTMRTDHGRNPNGGTAMIIYRGEFKTWSIDLIIRHNARVISPEQLLNLLANAGFSIGIGDWRPGSKNPGTFGMYHVKGAK